MKFIPFTKHETNNIESESRKFLTDMVRTSPMGQTFDEMERRLKVKAALDGAPNEGVTLEDADHATLLSVLQSRKDLLIADEGIFAIYKSVKDAKTVSVPKAKEPEEEAKPSA